MEKSLIESNTILSTESKQNIESNKTNDKILLEMVQGIKTKLEPFIDKSDNFINIEKSIDECLDILNEKILEIKSKENDKISNLLAITIHDIRNFLGQAIGFAKILKDDDDDIFDEEEKIKFINIINTAILSSIELIDSIINNLDLSKIEILDLNLKNEADNIIESYITIASNKDIKLINNVAEGINIKVNKSSLHAILRNLYSNALKFTPESGNITISSKQNNLGIELTIEDTGVGMSEDEIKKLVNPKHSFSKIGLNNEQGSGIGMKISLEMLENIGGKIKIESEVGVGSKFIITLPK